jgi:hypothetical protein
MKKLKIKKLSRYLKVTKGDKMKKFNFQEFTERYKPSQTFIDKINSQDVDPIVILRKLISNNELYWGVWFMVHIMTRPQYLACAIFAAEKAISIFDNICDDRLMESIDAAKKVLNNDTELNRKNAWSAATINGKVGFEYMVHIQWQDEDKCNLKLTKEMQAAWSTSWCARVAARFDIDIKNNKVAECAAECIWAAGAATTLGEINTINKETIHNICNYGLSVLSRN